MPKTSSTKNLIRFALLSDLHIYDKVSDGEAIPSHFSISTPKTPRGGHPLESLYELIDNSSIKSDYLICPGDLGDKSRPAAIAYGWESLQNLKEKLGASELIVTPGNHDHDSRSKHCKYDPKDILQRLSPPFPTDNESKNNQFWARHYYIQEFDELRIVCLNSSAYHGIGNEKDHGRISDLTIDRIKKDLESSGKKKLNLLVCHHHPQKHEDEAFDLEDYEVMTGSEALLRVIGDGKFGYWMIMHGHIHHPKLFYAQGTSMSPTIFSAGSFSAYLPPKLQGKVRNQFYTIEIDLSKIDKFGLVGRFESWSWADGIGWQPSEVGGGLPAKGGFGHRSPAPLVASLVAGKVKGGVMKGALLLGNIPELEYLIPDDLAAVKAELRDSHDLDLEVISGAISEIGKSE